MTRGSERILAIDYGTRWLGLAWSDPSRTIVAGSETIDRKHSSSSLEDIISEIVRERGVRLIVVGMPYNMDGTTGFKARETMQFIDRLSSALDIPVTHWDERLTSVRAESDLRILGGRKRSERRVDEMSASYILQSYLRGMDGQEAPSGTNV